MQFQQDSFYKQLPFTLPADQSKPSYVVLGTGLQECLLSAHLSKINMSPGLCLDLEKSYGASIRTCTIKQLHNFSTSRESLKLYKFLKIGQEEKNEQWVASLIQNKQYKGYNIDLEPSYFFGSSFACEMLKEADMDKYMDFRCVTNMVSLDDKGTMSNIPLSKGKIFSSSSLSLLQKKLLLSTFHSLIQIYNKHTNSEQDQNSTKQFDKEFGKVDEKLYNEFVAKKDQYFLEFVKKLAKNNQKIIDYCAYVIANYQYDCANHNEGSSGWGSVPQWARKQYSLEEFINKVGKFVRSCGVYSESPYLYVDNGIGDVPQSYSRIASLYLSTYIIHPRIQINKISMEPEKPLPPPPEPSQPENKNKAKAQQEQTPQVSGSQSKVPPPAPPCLVAPGHNVFHLWTNLSPTTPIQTPTMYVSPSYFTFFPDHQYYKQHILRIILICEKLGNEQQCPCIMYLTNINKKASKQASHTPAHPVFLFVFDGVSHSCPDGKILYQFEEVIDTHQHTDLELLAKQKVQNYVEVLAKARGQQFNNSINFVTAYIRQKRYPKAASTTPKNPTQPTKIFLKDHSGIDLDSQFLNFRQIVGEQKTYFRIIDKEGQPQYHHLEEFEGDQTVGLIEKLNSIDIHGTANQDNAEGQNQEEDEHQENKYKGEENANQQAQKSGRQQDVLKQVKSQQASVQAKETTVYKQSEPSKQAVEEKQHEVEQLTSQQAQIKQQAEQKTI